MLPKNSFRTVKYIREIMPNSYRVKDSEAATGGVLIEKGILKILQNLRENTSARVSFSIKLQTEACNFVKKKRLWQSKILDEENILKYRIYDYSLILCSQKKIALFVFRNFNSFMPGVPNIWKSVHWFIAHINGLVSMW